jgi:alpha-glucosidase
MSMRLTMGALVVLSFAGCTATAQHVVLVQGKDRVEIDFLGPNLVHVHVEPEGQSFPRTLVLDPSVPFRADRIFAKGSKSKDEGTIYATSLLSLDVTRGDVSSLALKDAPGHSLLEIGDLFAAVHRGSLEMMHDENETLYGMRGTSRDGKAEIIRNEGAVVRAGEQGDGGAPMFFTAQYGVLIDSDGGQFASKGRSLKFTDGSRKDLEFFLAVGTPVEVLGAFTHLSGRAPLPPKWTLGFLNSQWGSDEAEIRALAQTYADKQIPLSGFILDFDWKAWGEDDYGEWRWNSTSGSGATAPDKFPDGASGSFAADLAAQGVHLAGILKPRILVNRMDGQPTQASAYATAHGFWYPNEVRDKDYVTHRLAGNIDFNNAEARAWYWKHLEPAFHAGMTAWWNDEADANSKTVFNNFQFLNMGRSLYEGQRSISQERVFSINRNYYLGAARFGYAEWSGDIQTGFKAMAQQRARMVAALNLGLTQWSMDTGGFIGHPTAENYARWMEFATFVPIDRVHGNYGEKRQPWVYGPVAEAAAKHAIELRYDLLPYIYSAQLGATESGIGIVRPLFWIFPDDPNCAVDSRSWMFGDALLVSPVVEAHESVHAFYLPQGEWFDYASGEKLEGGRELSIPVDSQSWKDIPLYVRDGSIVVTQPHHGNELVNTLPLVLDIFPSSERVGSFVAYDDDGHTYGYEKGQFFRQQIKASVVRKSVSIEIQTATGVYAPAFREYVLRVHASAKHVRLSTGNVVPFVDEARFQTSTHTGWTTSHDRFGEVTLIRLPVSKSSKLVTLE